MSHEFKFKFDEMRDNNPAKQEDSYPSGSNVRNVCFIQSDGRMLFLNYGYLVSGEYLPDESQIVLNFTSHTITLHGIKLESLYQELGNHIPRVLVCRDERYSKLENLDTYSISQMAIQNK